MSLSLGNFFSNIFRSVGLQTTPHQKAADFLTHYAKPNFNSAMDSNINGAGSAVIRLADAFKDLDPKKISPAQREYFAQQLANVSNLWTARGAVTAYPVVSSENRSTGNKTYLAPLSPGWTTDGNVTPEKFERSLEFLLNEAQAKFGQAASTRRDVSLQRIASDSFGDANPPSAIRVSVR